AKPRGRSAASVRPASARAPCKQGRSHFGRCFACPASICPEFPTPSPAPAPARTARGSGLWPFATLPRGLAARREGRPCQESERRCLRTEGEMGLSGPHARPVSRGGLFPRPRRLSGCWRPGQRDPLESGRVAAFVPRPPVKPRGTLSPCGLRASWGAGVGLCSPARGKGWLPRHWLHRARSLFREDLFVCVCVRGCVRVGAKRSRAAVARPACDPPRLEPPVSRGAATLAAALRARLPFVQSSRLRAQLQRRPGLHA
ncbi:unnamed protein product, partial [Bubo scandiacus]